jgi:hypothetical protein
MEHAKYTMLEHMHVDETDGGFTKLLSLKAQKYN